MKALISMTAGIAFLVAVFCLAGCPHMVIAKVMDCHPQPVQDDDDGCLTEHFVSVKAVDDAFIPAVAAFEFVPVIAVLARTETTPAPVTAWTLRTVVLRI